MKKVICILLCLVVLLLCGCVYGSGVKEPVEFFYRRQSSQLKQDPSGGVIASELREASGHRNDYPYLLALYLRGPAEESLVSPFPSGCSLVDVSITGETMYVELSESFTSLQDMDLTVACVCLAKTCMAIASITCVEISAVSAGGENDVHITLEADSLLLEDEEVTLPAETDST